MSLKRIVSCKFIFGGFSVVILLGLVLTQMNISQNVLSRDTGLGQKDRLKELLSYLKDMESLKKEVSQLNKSEKKTQEILNRLEELRKETIAAAHVPGDDVLTAGEDSAIHKDDTSVADRLYKQVRVLCWVMTQPANLETRSRHIKKTWGRKCNKLLFFSSVTNKTFPTIGLDTNESRSELTRKTLRAFRHVHDHYLNDYDWFMRTDDDAYLVMENLRYFLSGQDPNGTLYFGRHFRTIVPGGYFAGGPGIVLGREALRRFGKHSFDQKVCPQVGSADDADLGFCMNNMGIKVGNTSDRLGRSRFHCFDPITHIEGNYPGWFYVYDTNGNRSGMPTLSDYPIGFHYVPWERAYEFEYFLYHARPYGIKFGDLELNIPKEQSKSHLTK